MMLTTQAWAQTNVAKIGDQEYATLEAAVTAATAGQTVTLLTNVELDEAVDINKSITLDLDGKTISISAANQEGYAISVSSGTVTITGNGTIDAGDDVALNVTGGTVTINNGTFNTVGVEDGSLTITDGTFGFLTTIGGTTTVNGGTFSETVQVGGGNLTINGGTFTAEDNVLQAMDDGTITVTGGSFIVTQSSTDYDPIVALADQDGLIQISGGTFTGGPLGVTDNTNGKFKVSGGQFSEQVLPEFCAAGYVPTTTADANGKYTVQEAPIVAQIGTTGYGTLAAAVAAVSSGQTIQLLANIDLGTTGIVIDSGKNFTLDLNGYDITGTVNGKLITNNGTLTISGNGHVYNQDISAQGNDAVYNTGTLVIEAGTFGDADDDMTNANALNRGAAVRNFGGTATINGGKFTACDNYTNGGFAYALINDNNGTMTINDAVVYGKNNGNIANNYGLVTVKDGTFTLNNASSYYSLYVDGEDGIAKTIVEGGTFNNTTSNGLLHTDDATNASLEISGGEFTYTNLTNNSSSVVSVSGGTFSSAVPDAFRAPGYNSIDNGNGTYTVGMPVAKIGGTEYATLQDAINAAVTASIASGNEVTVNLLTDVTDGTGLALFNTAKGTYPAANGANVKIDFGGFTYTVTGPAVGSTNTQNQVLHFEKGNTITLTNGTINMTTDATALAGFEMFMQNYGALTIDNMTIDGTGIAVATYGSSYSAPWKGTTKPQFNYNTAGSSVIRNSTITMPGDLGIDDNAGLTIEDDAVINVNKIATKGTDARYESATATISVENGAKFKLTDAAGATAFEALLNANGQTLGTTDAQGVYTVGVPPVAKIGTTEYASLEEAIAAANTDDTIELLADIDATAQIVVDKKVTLDLNGKTIEYKGTSTLSTGVIGVKRGADLTIKDSSDPSTGAIKSGNKAYAAVAVTIPGETNTGDPAKLTVNGGTLEGYYYGITGNGTRHGTEITINDGVIKGTCTGDNLGIYHPQDGTLTINGGTIEGYSSAIEVRSGTLNVTGGTFTATCPTYSCNPNGSGTTTTGAAIAIAQHTTNKPIAANISGGTFNVTGNGLKLSVANPQNNTFANVTVTGLNELIGESVVVPDGYTWKDNGDGTSSLAPVVAKIGDKGYASLKDAINAIAADGMPRTIQLVTDIADQEALEIAESNKSITIDMNGHKITAKENQPFNVTGNNVNLAFTGTGEIVNANNGYQGVSMRGENGHLTIGAGVTLTEATVFVRGKNNTVDINGKINVTGEQAAIQTNGEDTNTGNVINVNDPAVITSEDNAIYAAGDANYNINGGTITGASGVYIKSGKLTVTDGTIAATGAQAPYTANNNGADATGDGIVVDNCNYPSGSPEVSIKGGTITSENADPVASYSRNGQPKVTGFIYAGLYNKEFDASLLASGYVLQSNGSGMYTPVPGAGVAKIGDVYFPTLDAAIAAVPTDNTATTIELLTNINAAQRALIPSNTNITLDLGGFTLRCDDDFTIAFFDGAPGTVGTNKTENAQLTVKNGVVTSKKSYAIRTDGTGNTLTIAEDATIKAGNETDYALVVRGKNTTVTVNGTVEVLKGTAISTNGLDATNNNSIIINDPAKISSPNDNAIYLPSGSLTVNGGTITGTTGIYFKSKNLVIPAGSTAVITGTGEQRPAHYNGNGGNWTGDALVVDNANYPAGDPLADIQGGTFVSANALPIASYATGSSATAATKFVSGGKFNKVIPMDVIADGLICKLDASGDYYILGPGNYVAEVEGFGYETFAEAATAAGNDKIITLLADITDEYTLSEGQTLMVAKNGHTITVKAPDSFQLYTEDKDIDGVTVTIYTLKTDISQLIPDNLRSDWTGTEQSVPLVIKDGDYTLVKGTDYKLKDNTGADVDDIKKTDVGPVTFKVVGLGKYIGEKEVTWTIIKNINNDPIRIEIDPAVYTRDNIDPKDYIHVYDGQTELQNGADKDYTIAVTTTIQDAKTYVNAITITGTEKDPNYIGGEVTFSMSVQPGDVRDMTVDGNVQPWREAGYTAAQIADLITVSDNTGAVLVKNTDYTITVAAGTYKDAKTYEKIITITAKEGSNYTGTMKVDFTIMPEGLIDISKCVVTSKTVYTSQSQSPNYSNIEVVYKNGSNRVVLDSKQFDIQLNGTMGGYIDAKTYSNAITLVGTTKAGDSNTLRFYGSVNADYVIAPRDLGDTNFADDQVEVVLEKHKDMVWDGTDLSNDIKIGNISGENNLYLYLKVKDNGYRYPLANNDATGKYDYSYTVSPSPMIEPGEYTVTFTGRGNFTGTREVKINVLKDISQIAEGIEVPLQVIPNNTSLTPSALKDIVVKDGNKALELGVHYTIVIKNMAQTETFEEVTNNGMYRVIFFGKEPYYSNFTTKEMPVVFEYNHFNAEVNEQYYNGNTSGYQIVQPVSIHVTSGKNLECTVGDMNMPAVAPDVTSATLPGEAKFKLGNNTYTLKVVGIDNNAFDGAADKMHYLDATALTDYVPATLTRDKVGPFNGLPKQTLVFLRGTDFTGENYIYKYGDGDTDFRCDELKIYDDVSGVQTSFTEQDGYKWGFENPYEFKANTVTNTRQLNSGNGYTIYLPYALPTPTGIDAYTLTASKNDLLGFLPVTASTLEALTPYVLLANASGQLLSTTNATVMKTTDADPETTKVTSSAVSGQNTYTMYGNLKYNNGIEGAYIMQGGNVWKPILTPGSEGQGACILPMRAYIVVGSGSSPAPALQSVFGMPGSTDMDIFDHVGIDVEDGQYYDLQGRPVETPTRGVYVRNGKKVVIK